MGANNYGKVRWTCYNDCRMEGCPSHEADLWAKHGGYYLIYPDGKRGEIDNDIYLINAITWTLWRKRGMVEELENLEGRS